MIPVGIVPWVKLGALLAVLGALWFVYHTIDGRGYDRAKAEDAAKERSIAAQVAEAKETGTALAMSRERAHIREIDTAAAERYTTEASHEKTINALQRGATDGRVRLSVQLANARSACASASGQGGPAPGGSGEPTRADLMPGSTARILGFAADSARSVRDYNAVLVEFNRTRDLCNLDDAVAP